MTKLHQPRLSYYRALLFCAVALGGNVTAQEQGTAPKALVAAVDRFVQKLGITADSPGVAVLIHQPGRLHFQKGYGLANLQSGARITPDTLFELASCSKPFTATALLLLHDRGLLSIDDPVQKTIPELPSYGSKDTIHIRDLLEHTSGLPEYFDFADPPQRNPGYWVNADYLDQFAKQQADFPLQCRTGSKHLYCNSNYLLLASIVQRVAKKSFGQFLKEEIFTPLGMAETFVYESPSAVPLGAEPRFNRALGYEWRAKKQRWAPSWGTPPDRSEKVLVVGDGSIWSNLTDMVKWDAAVRQKKLLKAETWDLALSPAKTRRGALIDYGLGWSIYADKQGRVYGLGHDGSWGGFENSYYHHRGTNRSTVILSNHDTMDVDALWTALDALVERHLNAAKGGP